MGNQLIVEVIDALQSMGVRTERGFPGKGMPYPDTPVVAVNLHEQTEKTLTLSVMIYCTAAFGGTACEDLGMDIAVILQAMEGKCTVGSCSFDGKSGLFTLRVLAAWDIAAEPEAAFTVQIGDEILPYVTAVSARQDMRWSLISGEVCDDDNGWFITVTELLPQYVRPETDSTGTFTIMISRRGGSESYPNCRWGEIYHEPTAGGAIRRRVARTWSRRTVAAG